MKAVYLVLGVVFLATGVVGIFVPVLPTTPFLLLAAYAFSRSSSRLHRWMLGHRRLGPPIRLWQEQGAIAPNAKVMASVLIALSWGVTAFLVAPPRAVLIALTMVLGGVLVFLWTRPGGADGGGGGGGGGGANQGRN